VVEGQRRDFAPIARRQQINTNALPALAMKQFCAQQKGSVPLLFWFLFWFLGWLQNSESG
jgi:hypothetical protein